MRDGLSWWTQREGRQRETFAQSSSPSGEEWREGGGGGRRREEEEGEGTRLEACSHRNISSCAHTLSLLFTSVSNASAIASTTSVYRKGGTHHRGAHITGGTHHRVLQPLP